VSRREETERERERERNKEHNRSLFVALNLQSLIINRSMKNGSPRATVASSLPLPLPGPPSFFHLSAEIYSY